MGDAAFMTIKIGRPALIAMMMDGHTYGEALGG